MYNIDRKGVIEVSVKLTNKQKMFCREYLVDFNATQAAIRAGYSEKTAKDIGCQNLAKVYLQEEIQRLMDERSARVNISADDVLKDIIETRNTCKEYMLVEGEFGASVSSAAINGRNKSNELLGKHLKLFTDKVELEVTKMPTIKIGK